MRTACAQHIQRGPPPPRLALAPAHCRGIFVVGNRWRIGTPRSRKCLVARTLLGGSPGRCVTPKTLKSGHRLPKLAITCRGHDCRYLSMCSSAPLENKDKVSRADGWLTDFFCFSLVLYLAPMEPHGQGDDPPLFRIQKWPIITEVRANVVTGAHLGGHAGR